MLKYFTLLPQYGLVIQSFDFCELEKAFEQIFEVRSIIYNAMAHT